MHPTPTLIRSLLLLVLATTGGLVLAQQGKEDSTPSASPASSEEAVKVPEGDTLTVLPEIDSQLFSAGELIDTTGIASDSLPVVDTTRRDTLIEVQHALRVGIDLAAPLLRTHSRSRVLLPAQRYHTGPDGQLSAVMQAACTVAVYDEETGKLSTLVLEPGENRQAISV